MDKFNEIQEKLKKSDENIKKYDQEVHYGNFYDHQNDTQDEASSNERHRTPDTVVWGRVTLTILSMMVSSSFFAQYDVKTFYTGVVIVAAPQLKFLLIFSTFMAFLYEVTDPMPIIKLIEAVYMRRHEEDLVGEEECYRMLVEIVRSPELLK